MRSARCDYCNEIRNKIFVLWADYFGMAEPYVNQKIIEYGSVARDNYSTPIHDLLTKSITPEKHYWWARDDNFPWFRDQLSNAIADELAMANTQSQEKEREHVYGVAII